MENDFILGLLCSSLCDEIMEDMTRSNPALRHVEPINGWCLFHSSSPILSFSVTSCNISLEVLGSYSHISELVQILHRNHTDERLNNAKDKSPVPGQEYVGLKQ